MASKAIQAARDVLERNRQHAMGFAQQAGQARLRELLNDAAKDLAKRLQQAEGLKNADGSATFTAVQRRATLAQVQQVLRKLKGGLQDAVLEHGVQAAEGAAAGTAKYLTAADAAYKGVGVSPLAINEAAMLEAATDGARGSILRRLAGDPESDAQKGILERYGLETVGHFEKQLQVGFVAKKSWAEMRDDLTAASPFLQAQPRYWAERIVRTEVAGAHNRGLWESIREADSQMGDMVKILSAVFDDRTGSDSYAVHGQIRRPEEAFESWYGLYQHPPNRPNDREVVVAHRISWPIPPYLAWVDEEKVAKVWEAEGHKEAMPERPEMTTVPLDDFGAKEDEGDVAGKTESELADEQEAAGAQEQVPEQLEPGKTSDEMEQQGLGLAEPEQPAMLEPFPAEPPPPPLERWQEVMGEKIAGPGGSNDGGVYRGADGAERYVKLYKDPSQAFCEVIANNIYRDLGLRAPASEAFTYEGANAYASEMLKDVEQVGKLAPNLQALAADEILSGFAADALVGNWDAVGLSLDNVVANAEGRITRVDNGGSLLFRAKAGRKPDAALNALTEWDKFFDASVNPAYAKVAKLAGVTSADEVAGIKGQIEDVLKLRKREGGWAGYVKKLAPNMAPQDVDKVVAMLEARTTALEAKLEELKKPKPKKGAPITAEYGKRVKAPKPNAKNLAIREMPKLPTRKLPERSLKVPPGGENEHDWEAKVRAEMVKLPDPVKDSMREFTGGWYSRIRAAQKMSEADYISSGMGSSGTYEMAKDMGEKLEKMFEHAAPQPGQVFRGIHNLGDDVMEKFMTEDIIHAEASTSATRYSDTAHDFMGGVSDNNNHDNKVFFVIHQHSAVAVETHSSHKDELELVLSKETKFRVLSRHKAEQDPKCLVIECEEIKR